MEKAQSHSLKDDLEQTRASRSRKVLWWILGLTAALILLTAICIGVMAVRMSSTPADLDTSSQRSTEAGLYSIAYHSNLDTIPLNKIHSWTIHVETPDGKPVENAQVTVDGRMPQHGHGLPTRPQVTEYLGNGDYSVEGMKFQMTGWWEVKFTITADGNQDKVTFNLLLNK